MAGRRARGAQPARARSQHFLRTSALAAELVRDARVGPADLVLDIGAGGGRLTAELARRTRRVVAVELDPDWAAYLRGRWPNVDVVEADAVYARLPAEPFSVVANLPFDATTAILHHLLDDPSTPLVRAHVIVEWGVAVKRALPWPSTLNGVFWGAWYRFSIARRLPPAVFDPPPAVAAAVLVIDRRPFSLVPDEDWRRYREFVAIGLRRGPRAVAPPRLLRRLRLAGASARDLDAHRWAELFRRSR